MRLLLVEDCDDLRRLFARMLHILGYTVHEATDGQDALERAPAVAPELVVTDVMMPRLDGIALIRRLRGMPDLSRVPIVAISADPSPEREREVREAGADDFLGKPVDLMELGRRLEDCRLELPAGIL